MNELGNIWEAYLQRLDIAFQPIVCIHTGKTYGVEALLRGVEEIGFDSIADFFDSAYNENILYTFDLALREKVVKKFTQLEHYKNIKLFINLDNRLFEMPDYSPGNTAKILKKYGLYKEMISFEISERHAILNTALFEKLLRHYKDGFYNIAIDDFGVGVSGYQMLYRSTPDFIKIDRFFVQEIAQDTKKRILVRGIVQLATQLGVTVIAEGIENESEMLVCKELGCHLAQGYFIQRPQLDIRFIGNEYQHIAKVKHPRFETNRKQIMEHIEQIEPIFISDKMSDVLERFKKSKDVAIPVVNKARGPLGILNESKLKELIVSPYGRSLLMNESPDEPKIKRYMNEYATIDIHSTMDQIVECFSNYKDAKGIIITKDLQYYGFLSASNIISIINERNLACARDQNPLTKMPGNHQIDYYINKTLSEDRSAVLSYFDLNHFKAYNDTYGFRKGDRVIQLFADILKTELSGDFFKGHIGGDDFFIGTDLKNVRFEEALEHIYKILEKFKIDVSNMYDTSDRERGYIIAKDREGKEKEFDLLSVSAVVVRLDDRSQNRSIDMIHKHFATQKKAAKAAEDYINISTLL